jgi:hypothetical protein
MKLETTKVFAICFSFLVLMAMHLSSGPPLIHFLHNQLTILVPRNCIPMRCG